jgi:hypothetical protein
MPDRMIGSSEKDAKAKARLLDDEEVERLEAEQREKDDKERASK